jgi:RNA polymerase sigma factor (sigma-70 family)
LLKGAQRGRRADLEELFRRELPPLRRWAFAHVPSSVRRAGDTDDFVQLALLRTLRRLPYLATGESGTLQPYLRRVLANLVRDRTRSVGRGPAMSPLDDDDLVDQTSPLEALIAAELHGRYRAALAALSRRERTALRARLERGLAYREVARCAGCVSTGAARVMVGRALARVEEEIRRAGADRKPSDERRSTGSRRASRSARRSAA